MTTPTEIRERLVAVLARELRLHPDEIEGDKELTRYGLDSLASVEVLVELERLLGRELPETFVYEAGTVDEMVAAFAAEGAEGGG